MPVGDAQMCYLVLAGLSATPIYTFRLTFLVEAEVMENADFKEVK